MYESLYFALSTKPDIEHHEQCYDWDCGQTCLKMVLGFCDIQRDMADALIELEDLNKYEKPLWTIDLFVFLKNQGVSASFHTLCPSGVSAHHEDIAWYQSTNLVSDAQRVRHLFALSVDKKWPVIEVIH
jgi:hypothetical protein